MFEKYYNRAPSVTRYTNTGPIITLRRAISISTLNSARRFRQRRDEIIRRFIL